MYVDYLQDAYDTQKGEVKETYDGKASLFHLKRPNIYFK